MTVLAIVLKITYLLISYILSYCIKRLYVEDKMCYTCTVALPPRSVTVTTRNTNYTLD